MKATKEHLDMLRRLTIDPKTRTEPYSEDAQLCKELQRMGLVDYNLHSGWVVWPGGVAMLERVN